MTNDQIIIYQTADGQTSIDVKLEYDTIWLSLSQLTTLFGRDKSVISRHLKNVFKEEELDRDSVVAKNATTASDEYFINRIQFYERIGIPIWVDLLVFLSITTCYTVYYNLYQNNFRISCKLYSPLVC